MEDALWAQLQNTSLEENDDKHRIEPESESESEQDDHDESLVSHPTPHPPLHLSFSSLRLLQVTPEILFDRNHGNKKDWRCTPFFLDGLPRVTRIINKISTSI